MKAQEVTDYIFQIAPNPDFGTENIYEIGGGETEVKAVGVAWWITSDMLEDFARKGVTLGVTHERVIYDVPGTYPWGTPCKTDELSVNRRIPELCRKHGIAIHRFHSNIDLVEWGMPRALVAELGWENFRGDWSRGVPVIDHPPVKLRDLIADVKAKLKLPFVRYDGDPERIVRRIAIAWGGLGQWWTGAACAAPLGFDVLLSGDVIDGVVRLAREEGWCVIDAFHHATELAAMRLLAKKIQERFPQLAVHYVEQSMPWSVA
jgi:putative NIF3 family GTP cyclohydrolase 1 type 2